MMIHITNAGKLEYFVNIYNVQYRLPLTLIEINTSFIGKYSIRIPEFQ